METAIKVTKRGIYNYVPTGIFVGGVEQKRAVKVGERTVTYSFVAHDDCLEIDGVKYRVKDDREWAIKIMKTHIKAIDGPKGLLKLILTFWPTLDTIEQRIIEKCKPMK